MKKTNSNMIVGFFRFIALMLVVMGMFTAAKAQPTNLNMYFINDSGYEDHEIWFSWQRMGPFAVQPSPTNQINYGVSNASSVTWGNGGSNLMSDMINYTNLYTTVNNHQYAAFSVVQATSANLYVTYGGVFSNLATAPADGTSTINLFPYAPIEIDYQTNNTFSGGDLSAINVFSIGMNIQNYATGVTNFAVTNALQSVGFNYSAQHIFTNYMAPLTGYTPGQIDNASVFTDAQSNVVRVVPVNSLAGGSLGSWQSFSNYLAAIHASNNQSVLIGTNGFFLSAPNEGTNYNVYLAYNMTGTVNNLNDIIVTGTYTVITNISGTFGVTNVASPTNFYNLSITNYGAGSPNTTYLSPLPNGLFSNDTQLLATGIWTNYTTLANAAQLDSAQSWEIYNQSIYNNLGFDTNTWNDFFSYVTNVNITTSQSVNSGTNQFLNNYAGIMNVVFQNPMGDYTTGLLGGFVNSTYSNLLLGISNAVGSYNSYEWFNGIGTDLPSLFATLQPDNPFYNQYAGIITETSSNSVYSIPFGDRLPNNIVTLTAVSNGTDQVGSWVVTLGTPITPVGVPPTPGDKTNIINAITVLTNGAVNIGNVTDDHFWEVINGGELIITNAPGMTVSARIGNNSDAVDNAAIVTGAGSLWSNAQTVIVGNNGANNSLTIDNGGAFHAGGLRVGSYHTSTGNTVVLNGAGSQMIITNGAGDALTDIRRGTFTQNGGTFRTDRLNVTDAAGLYDFNGGTAFVGVANVNNGQNFQVGNGTDTAFFSLAQNGQVNTFANGITVNDNATFSLGGVVTNQITLNSGSTLKGQGTYVGDLTVGNGATLSVGNSPGTLNITGTLTWASGGSNIWEINSFTGTQGADPGWDFINVVGGLDITAIDSNPFLFNVRSLTLGNAAGLAAGFNDASDYDFVLVQTTLGVTGFAADKFNLSLANFQNPFTGTWSLGVTGNTSCSTTRL
ncbi:hypothetical protein QPK87_36285 [Kamptonema cortianum]|nr:hypothetical protein [Kamptonema cortianum]